MLVLSRKAGERISIGDSITIVVLESSNGRVRIGIDAPREISITRSELVNREFEFGGIAIAPEMQEMATAGH